MNDSATADSLFKNRHLDNNQIHIHEMLQALEVSTLQELIEQIIPQAIRLKQPLSLGEPKSEQQFLSDFRKIGQKNKLFKQHIGQGYYNTYTPTVILRNILENPGWYTAYTPYQAEIAQGRLEALINFQTLVTELTGMELSNASLLDEATAAAEAMAMLYALRATGKSASASFFVSDNCFEQTIDVLKTRAAPLGIKLVVGDEKKVDLTDPQYFGMLIQYPGADGEVYDYRHLISAAKEQGILVAMCTDLLSLCILMPPGEMGADAVVGSAQRFGVPMGYGGPHAAFLATKEAYKRHLPGRIIGVSVDAKGNKAYRMALQTREQHIKREKATSNICTAQVLLSVMASMYAVYHGPQGLLRIARRVHGLTRLLEDKLELLGFKVKTRAFFDTLSIEFKGNIRMLRDLAERAEYNFYYNDIRNEVRISLDETSTLDTVQDILAIFAKAIGKLAPKVEPEEADKISIPEPLLRQSKYLTHPVFNTYHTEHELLRYMKRLENKDISMVHSMISLGSCTMKLNATTEMIPVTWPEFSQLHPFVPKEQALGYAEVFKNLEKWLAHITGFHSVSLQPNSGAQGEYAGLMTIKAYHASKGHHHRNIALIPSSAHGTNPASAVMAGMQVVVTKCDDKGNIDLQDLRQHAEQHRDNLACLMITYPSTHGVFEETVQEICNTIHGYGGLVYMDGANMNAQVGLTSPANIGADVCHLNLHKTFCIPHGGGGPGMGPICVAEHLAPYLPGHVFADLGRENTAVSAAPWGSASILVISYAYIYMMGGEGVTDATRMAILNANYMKSRLEKYYPILYTGTSGRCAHEFILDCRSFKPSAGIEVEDIAKRLMDYGYHAPTVSFPVAGTLMIEPTESETKAELDRFCDAMIAIRKEIEEIEQGMYDRQSNVLKHAPHTAEVVTSDLWEYPYPRQKAAYPLPWVSRAKVWPSVSRIDSAYGDRNLICSCIPMEDICLDKCM